MVSKQNNGPADWSGPASLALEKASYTWDAPNLDVDGRNLPDANLDALAEAMLASLRKPYCAPVAFEVVLPQLGEKVLPKLVTVEQSVLPLTHSERSREKR